LSLFTFFCIIGIIGIAIIIRIQNTVVAVAGHWQHFFDACTYSSQHFYQSVEAIIKGKEIPGLTVERITYSEGGMLSANREYLRVRRDTLVFDICAAPFGNGFFISSWQGLLPSLTAQIISGIPLIGGPLGRMLFTKTYFQMDTEYMFASSVHHCVLEAIQRITEEKGMRELTEFEKRLPNARS
jgi:hypothetical protein